MTPQELHKIFLKDQLICTDSRKIETGAIYFALKGENFDGNKFAQQALESGASYAVIDNPDLAESNKKLILVPDCLEALQELARIHRDSLKTTIIGITGTNGKTTTKELLNAVLSASFSVQATKGNLNNHIGVPLTILEITENTEIAIVEMGANHPGEIEDLCKIASPDFGIITNIGKAHLEGFGNRETIIETKRALYEAVRKKNGTVFYNSDNDILSQLSEGIHRVSYGMRNPANLTGAVTANNPFLQLSFEMQGSHQVNTKLVGAYNFENVLAAISCGIYFKIPVKKIIERIEQYIPSNNRSQVAQTASNLLILDAYNANPTSLEKAIRNFIELENQAKVLIIGDMLELGSEEENEHLAILEILSEIKDAQIFLVGPVFKRLAANSIFQSFLKAEEAREYFRSRPLKGKTILIKGSRGIHLELLNEVL